MSEDEIDSLWGKFVTGLRVELPTEFKEIKAEFKKAKKAYIKEKLKEGKK